MSTAQVPPFFGRVTVRCGRCSCHRGGKATEPNPCFNLDLMWGSQTGLGIAHWQTIAADVRGVFFNKPLMDLCHMPCQSKGDSPHQKISMPAQVAVVYVAPT